MLAEATGLVTNLGTQGICYINDDESHHKRLRFRPSPGVAELFSGDCRGCGATLIGARVTGVRVTPTSGF
jgi:hypothetical protein